MKQLLRLTRNAEGEVWLHVATQKGLHGGFCLGRLNEPTSIIDRSIVAAIEEQDAAGQPPMTLNEFQQATARTLPAPGVNHWFDAPNDGANESEFYKKTDLFNKRIDLLHAILGVCGESGEKADPVKKSMFYGKPLDVENIKEEAGDLLWYIAGPLCRALGCTLEELAAANVAKLRKRYPEKYSDAAAVARADKAEVGAPFDETLPKPAAV